MNSLLVETRVKSTLYAPILYWSRARHPGGCGCEGSAAQRVGTTGFDGGQGCICGIPPGEWGRGGPGAGKCGERGTLQNHSWIAGNMLPCHPKVLLICCYFTLQECRI